jgi:hypothetical protein
MKRVIGVVLAVYNFFVGDPILLAGVLLTFLIVGLVDNLSALHAVQPASMAILFAGVLLSLALSLARETQPKRH